MRLKDSTIGYGKTSLINPKTKGKSMKKLVFIILIAALFIACPNGKSLVIPDDANTNTVAYLTGRGSYFGAAEVSDHFLKVSARREMFDELEARYKTFLDNTISLQTIPSEESVKLFNDLIAIMAGYVDDPYLLLADLTFLLQQYGAVFVKAVSDENPDMMTAIQPIPRSVYVNFDLGWHVSARVKK